MDSQQYRTNQVLPWKTSSRESLVAELSPTAVNCYISIDISKLLTTPGLVFRERFGIFYIDNIIGG